MSTGFDGVWIKPKAKGTFGSEQSWRNSIETTGPQPQQKRQNYSYKKSQLSNQNQNQPGIEEFLIRRPPKPQVVGLPSGKKDTILDRDDFSDFENLDKVIRYHDKDDGIIVASNSSHSPLKETSIATTPMRTNQSFDNEEDNWPNDSVDEDIKNINFDDIKPVVQQYDMNNSLMFRPVRKKHERAKLDGWDCDLCREYYKDLEEDMHPSELQRLKNNCSRHRSYKSMNQIHTPPDAWKTTLPSTEEAIKRGLLKIGVPSQLVPPKRHDLLD